MASFSRFKSRHKNIFHLGKKFLDVEEITSELSKNLQNEKSTDLEIKLLLNSNKLRAWKITNIDTVFFVLDNGKTDRLYSIPRDNFDFKLDDFVDKQYGKLLVRTIDIPIVYDKNYTGNTEIFAEELSKDTKYSKNG